jgi:hypothetical protein
MVNFEVGVVRVNLCCLCKKAFVDVKVKDSDLGEATTVGSKQMEAGKSWKRDSPYSR